MSDVREKEVYGEVALSVQASDFHYCEPRENGLDLSEYESVEVAVMLRDEGTGRWKLARPEDAGLEEFERMFEPGTSSTVAGYVSQEDVERMRAALRLHAGMRADEPAGSDAPKTTTLPVEGGSEDGDDSVSSPLVDPFFNRFSFLVLKD